MSTRLEDVGLLGDEISFDSKVVEMSGTELMFNE